MPLLSHQLLEAGQDFHTPFKIIQMDLKPVLKSPELLPIHLEFFPQRLSSLFHHSKLGIHHHLQKLGKNMHPREMPSPRQTGTRSSQNGMDVLVFCVIFSERPRISDQPCKCYRNELHKNLRDLPAKPPGSGFHGVVAQRSLKQIDIRPFHSGHSKFEYRLKTRVISRVCR
ncbi:MAG: hypothetical protein BWY42_00830 [Candidatus Omnitrophica bacterium ADurb.Bin277]|nr:MAG: hypothetical protein BWY42_00830 [Candidatus Omnitrophica bacterium ADurb.Bin277]